MRYTTLRGVEVPVSSCVLGTSGIRDERGFAILDRFLTAGGNCIDTARVYGGGASEHAVGAWIRRSRPEQLVIVGKGAHPPNCRPEAIGTELAESLDRLGVSRIDVYLLHRDDPAVPVGEFVDALEEQRQAGRIGAYGGSNWRQERITEANRYAHRHGAAGMTALSNHFSLADPVEPLYPGCEGLTARYRRFLVESGIALLPWSSQARGFFSDVPREKLDPNMSRCWDTAGNRSRRDRAAQLAQRLRLQPINVALAYVLSQPFTALPIIGPQNEQELRTALRAADIVLDAGQLDWLESGIGSLN
jgi:aryl-alcohol dehydrogenase-like predicted oxidoreductase